MLSEEEYEAQDEVVSRNQFAELLAEFTPLPELPLPPMLLKAIGYSNANKPATENRYVSLYWEQAGDEAVFYDGRVGGDGDWHSYLAFMRYPAVKKHISGYNLGSSEGQRTHSLLLDRVDGKWYVGEADRVELLCQVQYLVGMSKVEFDRQMKAEQTRIEELGGFEEILNLGFEDLGKQTFNLAAFQERADAQERIYNELCSWLAENYPVKHSEPAATQFTIIFEQGGDGNGQQN